MNRLFRRRRIAKRVIESLFEDEARVPHLEVVRSDGSTSKTRNMSPDMFEREKGLTAVDFAVEFLADLSATPIGPSTWETSVPEIKSIIARNFTGEQVGSINDLLSMA